MKKRLLASVLVAVTCTSLAACGGGTQNNAVVNAEDFEPVTLRFGNQHPVDSIASEADQRICDAIEEATDGRVKVVLYTDSSLGDYTSIFEEVMLGTIDMCHITCVETYDPKMSAPMLPYLGSNYEELAKAYSPDNYLYQTLFESAKRIGLHTFGFFCEGFNGVGTSGELTNPQVPVADKGALVRTPGMDIYSLSAIDLGFRTSQIAYSDTYTAIQTGTVDGWVGGPPSLNYLYFRDVINYFYHYMMVQEATQIMMSEKVWETLLPEDQEAIDSIIKAECAGSIERAAEDDARYLQMLKDAGITVVEFTDEERAEMARSCHDNVWPKLAKNTSQEFLDGILASME